ncbi:protein kinase, putative [Trypanosoma brucei gambiense DAL972]|uniref:Protein kinase, putative n=1 Tax=Trypanosoma brucei gambiense (strain MHOM/CI/86/DAL972) TaxID=679716 RepID=C9ZX68_TRYB9|nr:protein kinase, putative [Trypanosoma brucei gambiense DAL972]CBH14012.1 protein kinase, putative [Trypanosoma brucei gambiense DAL972]|eukprot:XP_011776283.1 protein kinase, putative [Trypanosoma brucei gambiense DAL972]
MARDSGFYDMLPALHALPAVEAVVVDRLRPWRRRRERAVAELLFPQNAATAEASESPIPKSIQQPSLRRRRANSAMESAVTHLCYGRRAHPRRTAIALHHPQVLVFTVDEPSALCCSEVQKTLRSVDGPVQIQHLLASERDFYGAQMDYRRTKSRTRRGRAPQRAASVPALTYTNCETVCNDGICPCSKSVTTHKDGDRGVTGSVSNKNGAGVLSALHECKIVDSLQDLYAFHPGRDYIDCGAFSRVYRAVPLFQGTGGRSCGADNCNRSAGPSDSFVAIKVIPRVRSERGGRYKVAPHAARRGESDMGRHVVSSTSAQHCACGKYPRQSESDAEWRQLQRIAEEVSILAALEHSGCSHLIGTLQTPEEFAIVMDMGKGNIDALRYVRAHGPLNEAHASLIVYQLVEAVNYLHNVKEVLHRDIKLENILLSRVDQSISIIRKAMETGGSVESSPRPKNRSHTHNEEDVSGRTEKEHTKRTGDGCERGNRTEVADSKARSSSYRWWEPVSVNVSTATDEMERLLKVTLIDFGLSMHTSRCSGTGNPSVEKKMEEGSDTRKPIIRKGSPKSSGTVAVGGGFNLPELSFASCGKVEKEPRRVDDVAGGEGTLESKQEESEDDEGLSHRVTVPVAISNNTPPVLSRAGSTSDSTAKIPTTLLVGDEEDGTQQDRQPKGAMPTRAIAGAQGSASVPLTDHECPAPSSLLEDDSHHHDDTLLSFTPCGTERYLPPEILQWILQRGWKQKTIAVCEARKLDAYAVGIVTYVLLSGCFPFNGTSRATMWQQKLCVPACNSSRWENVSTVAISFVQSLLDPQPRTRFELCEALTHPWMRQGALLAKKLSLVPHSMVADANLGEGEEEKERSNRQLPRVVSRLSTSASSLICDGPAHTPSVGSHATGGDGSHPKTQKEQTGDGRASSAPRHSAIGCPHRRTCSAVCVSTELTCADSGALTVHSTAGSGKLSSKLESEGPRLSFMHRVGEEQRPAQLTETYDCQEVGNKQFGQAKPDVDEGKADMFAFLYEKIMSE